MIYNDFKPECRSLIRALRDGGFTIVGGHNGEERFAPDSDFIENLTATDESDLYITKRGFKFTLNLILGNSPGELVADYCFSRAAGYSSALADLDKITEAHYTKWQGRKQPTRTI